jgi:hypothetical protein
MKLVGGGGHNPVIAIWSRHLVTNLILLSVTQFLDRLLCVRGFIVLIGLLRFFLVTNPLKKVPHDCCFFASLLARRSAFARAWLVDIRGAICLDRKPLNGLFQLDVFLVNALMPSVVL